MDYEPYEPPPSRWSQPRTCDHENTHDQRRYCDPGPRIFCSDCGAEMITDPLNNNA